MNHGQDSVSGEIIRSLCDEFESLLGTYHNVKTATGGRYDNPEILLEALIEHLRSVAPEPEEPETDEERIKRWKKMDKEMIEHNIKLALGDEGDSIVKDRFPELGQNIQAAEEGMTLEDEGDSI